MRRFFLRSKLHMARVTKTDLEYEGSIAIDPQLLKASDIRPYEQVDVYNVNSGQRFTTYAIQGDEGSREICINGAAARMAEPGDRVIIACYCDLEEGEISNHKPRVVLLNEKNEPKNL